MQFSKNPSLRFSNSIFLISPPHPENQKYTVAKSQRRVSQRNQLKF